MKKLLFLTLIISSIGISLHANDASTAEMTIAQRCYDFDRNTRTGKCLDTSKKCYSSGYCYTPSSN